MDEERKGRRKEDTVERKEREKRFDVVWSQRIRQTGDFVTSPQPRGSQFHIRWAVHRSFETF